MLALVSELCFFGRQGLVDSKHGHSVASIDSLTRLMNASRTHRSWPVLVISWCSKDVWLNCWAVNCLNCAIVYKSKFAGKSFVCSIQSRSIFRGFLWCETCSSLFESPVNSGIYCDHQMLINREYVRILQNVQDLSRCSL